MSESTLGYMSGRGAYTLDAWVKINQTFDVHLYPVCVRYFPAFKVLLIDA